MPTERLRVYFPVEPEILDHLKRWARSQSRTLPNLCEVEMTKAAKHWASGQRSLLDAVDVVKRVFSEDEPSDQELLAAIATLEKGLSD